MKKKVDIKNYILLFIEMFNVWQMGVIFYSSKSLVVNNIIKTPIELDYLIIFMILGYLTTIIINHFIPDKTIIISKVLILISLFTSILLLLPISPLLFRISYYFMTFTCLFFTGTQACLIINYYDSKTALKDIFIASLSTGLLISLFQNQIIPLSFNSFLIISIICLLLITIGLFKLPFINNIKFINKNDKVRVPSKKLIICLVILTMVTCLNTLFSSSIAENIYNGVSITYLGSLVFTIIFILLYKKYPKKILRLYTYFLTINVLGFLLYIIPYDNMKYIALFLQGSNFLLIMITLYFANNLFEMYPSKKIVPSYILIAFIAVIFSSILLELYRDNPMELYSIYSIISIIIIVLYLVLEQDLEIKLLNEKYRFDKLSNREKEVADLIIKGYKISDIAKILFLSDYTVNDHMKKIYKKYNVNSKMQFLEEVKNEQ